MSAGAAYALGVLTPFVALIAAAAWNWGLEGLSNWWHRKRPTLGRLRCLLGHSYWVDRGTVDAWKVCRRCGHAERLSVVA